MSQKVREALLEQLARWIPASVVGIVTDVNAPDTCTVQPIDEGAEYFNVRLRGTVDGTDAGMYAEPKVGSCVIITPLMHDDEQMYVSRFTEVEKWHIITDSGSKVEVLANGEVHLNGSNKGGLVIVSDLVTKLNRLENKVNDHIAAYNSHIHITTATVGASTTPGTISPTTSTETPIAPLTQVSDLHNQKVRHGS
jgi:hypothetical protein